MTTIQVELPDATAKAARDAGLLTPQSLARLLNEALKRQQAADALLSVAARVTAGGIPSMSVDEINAEVKAARTSRICSRRQSDLSQQRRTPCCKKSVRGPVSGHYRTPCRKRHSADVQPQRDRAPIGRPSRTDSVYSGRRRRLRHRIAMLVLLFGFDIKLAGSLSLAVSLPTIHVGFARNTAMAISYSLQRERLLLALGPATMRLTGA
jgi:hypothetical protein